MENKKTKGRQKIPIEKIENKDKAITTFTKRREGLYRKASKLIAEFNIDIGIIMFSPTGKPHSFFYPTVDAIISRFQNTDMQLRDDTQNTANQVKNELEEFDIRKAVAIDRINYFDQISKTRQKGWWESIEQLNADEVSKFDAWLNTGSFNLQHRLNQLENGASSSFGCESSEFEN